MRHHSPWEYRKVFFLHACFGVLTATVVGAVLVGTRWSSVDLRNLDGYWPLLLLAYSVFLHAVIAVAAWRRKPWVFEKSEELALLLLMAAPFGTISGLIILVAHWRDRAEIARRPRQVPLTEGWPDSDRQKP
jgi:hypothetical protein